MNVNYYVIGYPPNEVGYRYIADLANMENVVVIRNIYYNKIYKKLYDFYAPRKERFYMKIINPIIHSIVFKRLFYGRCYSLSRISFRKDTINCILMINSGFCYGYSKQYMEYIRTMVPNAYLVLYQMDPTDKFYTMLYKEKVFDMFDLVYNINKEDADRYQQEYWPLVCSMDNGFEQEKKIPYDIYFCGFGTDRSALMSKMYLEARTKDVRTKFLAYYFRPLNYEGVEDICEQMSYQQNLKYISESNCLLEIMHDDYDNQTLRYGEAVMYNKKLLSNNKKITTYPFYNEKYMKVFESIEDIDWEWIKRREDVEYHYHNEFSASLLIQDIDERIQEAKRIIQ